ncbi:MAG: c-type cytochrome [bacterium]
MGRSVKFFILAGTLFLMLVQSIWALDGQKLYTEKFCITCHGKKGISVAPNYPNLAGQNLEYMKNQVSDIIAGKRKTKLTLLMTSNPVVMKISPEETSVIAEYLTKLK